MTKNITVSDQFVIIPHPAPLPQHSHLLGALPYHVSVHPIEAVNEKMEQGVVIPDKRTVGECRSGIQHLNGHALHDALAGFRIRVRLAAHWYGMTVLRAFSSSYPFRSPLL